jgi:hypothetical protein
VRNGILGMDLGGLIVGLGGLIGAIHFKLNITEAGNSLEKSLDKTLKDAGEKLGEKLGEKCLYPYCMHQ